MLHQVWPLDYPPARLARLAVLGRLDELHVSHASLLAISSRRPESCPSLATCCGRTIPSTSPHQSPDTARGAYFGQALLAGAYFVGVLEGDRPTVALFAVTL